MTFNGQTLVDKTKKGDPELSSSVGKRASAALKCKVSFFWDVLFCSPPFLQNPVAIMTQNRSFGGNL